MKIDTCDDYAPKPFCPREDLAKIRQHLTVLDRRLFAAMHISAFGPKRTFYCVAFDVAIGCKADMAFCTARVRL